MAPPKNLMEFFSRRSPKTPNQPLPDQPDKEDEESGSAGGNGSQGSGSKRRRPVRRCVRKLPLDLEADGIEGEGKDEGMADGGGSSGGRKLTKTTGKTTPRTSRRSNRKNASKNENDNSQGPIGYDEEYAALCLDKSGSDFFVKLSEKRKRRKSLQQKKGETDPEDTRIADEVHQNLRMLKDDLSSREENGLQGQIRMLENNHFPASNRSDRSNNSSPAKAIDLRLEAKRAAEENARLFAGKQMHPFFVSCQSSKRLSETCHLGSRGDSVLQEDMTMTYAPLHVLQTSQEDEVLLNWQDWVVFEENLLKRADPIVIESLTLAWCHGSKPLKFDSFVSIPNLSESTFLEQQLERRKSGLTASTSSPSLSGHQTCQVELEAYDHAPVDITKNHVCGKLDDKRMKSYYLRCSRQLDANLWVDKYQPDSASEVCGNSDSVKFINKWMHSWYIQNPASDKISPHNDDGEWIEDDDAVNDMNGVAENILLLTGPIGSGKSAAIYACAKEQGFQIIEVSASDWRSGTIVKQKFREAMESQCLKKWSNEDPVGSQNQQGMRAFPIENKGRECGNSGYIRKHNSESASPCLAQESTLEMKVSCNSMECRSLGNQIANKTLILFEDFDATLDEDRGLIATILELAETTKRPIILTSNCRDNILPPLVDRVSVNFTLPSVDELVSHAYMICVSEATNISLQLIEHVVGFCRSDIRKTLMFLQFWCQGGTDQGGNKLLCAHGPVPFNIDAGHYVIKKVIPWGFPSQLSEYIEEEVSKSLAKMKAIALLMDETVTEELGIAESSEVWLDNENEDMSNEDDLSKRKSPMHDFALESSIRSDSSPCKTVETTKQSRQKRRVVVSDSEDEPYINKLDLSEPLPQHLGEGFLLDLPSNPFSLQEPSRVNYLDATLHENLLGGPIRNGDGCTHDLNGSPKMSCIPELSFVAETKIDNGDLELTSSVSCFPDTGQNACLGSSHMLKELGMELINPVKADGELDRVSETVCWGACDAAAESVLGCDDSHLDPPQAIFRTCPLIDECSRAEFSSSFMTETKLKRPVVADLVQETWKKLRSEGPHIKFCIETEQCASSSLKIANGLTELISDADVMLNAGYLPVKASIFDEVDQHADLMSTFAEHGLCFYAKKSAPLSRHLDPTIKLDLGSEILFSSMDGLTIGTLVARESGDGSTQVKLSEGSMEVMLPDRLEDNSMLSDALLTVVPIRSYMASRGAAYHEYVSFFSQISKGESTRLDQEGKSRRCGRLRGARHYLRTGAFSMSAEDVLLLDRHACYKKRDPKSIDEG